VFGPIEVLYRLDGGVAVRYVSSTGGLISGSGGARVWTEPLSESGDPDILLVPGGLGTRKLVEDGPTLKFIRATSQTARFVLSVCTGSALLAKAGVLSHRRATSNKLAWDWVVQQSAEVEWVRKARWVVDAKFYTSAGVSAGIDMALGFVRDQVGIQVAESFARGLEYVWNREEDQDPF